MTGGALLAVLAHPDDESMGMGGLLARHAAAGVPVHLLCVTRGGAGWQGKPAGARPEDLPDVRAAELAEAAAVLGLESVVLWDYPDGDVPGCDLAELAGRIGEVIAALRPRAVVGWGPDGGYGHTDHIAVGRCTDEAVAALDPAVRPALYHLAADRTMGQAYRDIFVLAGSDEDALPLVIVDGAAPVVELSPAEVARKLAAIDRHASQLEDWRVAIRHLPDLLSRAYGREVYLPAMGGSRDLTAAGLLGEFG